MLDRIALDRVLSAARSQGLHSCEIYAETCQRVRCHWHERLEDISFESSGGVTLTASDSQGIRVFSTSEFSTEALLRVLGDTGNPDETTSAPKSRSQSPKLREPLAFISQLARASFSDPRIQIPELIFEGEQRTYEVVTEEREEIRRGEEESALIQANWKTHKKGTERVLGQEIYFASLGDLSKAIRGKNPFSTDIEDSLTDAPQWPAPRGAMPILWMPRALSKLIFPFARAFEGDLVLSDRSFLTHATLPLSLSFALEDLPSPIHDHEGSPTKPLVLFDDGRPRALALDHRLAAEFSTTSTGHCRRSSRDSAPTVALWRTRLRPRRSVERLEQQLEWGLKVDDVHLSSFDTRTGDATLRITRAHLIHHGETGEAVEPISLTTNLLDILGALKSFSTAEESHAFPLRKRNQRLMTEIVTPAALSETLEVPGVVPHSHYW